MLASTQIYIYMVVYRVLSIYRVLPGFREFAVFEKSKRFFYIFFGWVLHRGGQGPGKGPNQAQNRKGCLTAPLSVTGGHILIQIGNSSVFCITGYTLKI